MRYARWFLPALLLAALPSVAQTAVPAAPPSPAAPPPGASAPQNAPRPPEPRPPDVMKGLLAEVYAHDTFAYLPGPYHFLATFDTFTADGKPAGTGSIEKFVSAQGRSKLITRFRDHSMTAWSVVGEGRPGGGEGRPVYTDDGFDGTIMTYMVSDFLLTPLPPPLVIARQDMETSLMPASDGKMLDCGMYQQFVNPTGLPPAPKETYCVTRGVRDLVLRQTQHFSIQYTDFEPFQGRRIARSIVAMQGDVVRCRIHVEQVDQQALDEAAMTPPADASTVSPAPEWYALNRKESTPLHQTTPAWPSGVKASTQGFVTMRLVISRTGQVTDAEAIYAPSPQFVQAAIDAVKQWTYAPIVRRDKPVEAMTAVILSFGN